MQPHIVNYQSARFSDECLVFRQLLNVYMTAIDLAFIKKDNKKMTISHEVIQRIDAEMTASIVKGFGRLMYFFPEQENAFVTLAIKLEQENKSFPNAIQYLELFEKFNLTQKLEWYKDNTVKDVRYRGILQEVAAEMDNKDSIIKQLSKEIGEREGKQVYKVGQYDETEISNIARRNIQLTSEVNELHKKFKNQKGKDSEIIAELKNNIKGLEAQLKDTSCCFDDLTKAEQLIKDLQREIKQQEILLNKSMKKVEKFKKANLAIREENSTLKLRLKDASSSEHVSEKNYLPLLSVNVNNMFCLWNFEYNQIVKKANRLIRNGFETYENALNIFSTITKQRDMTKILSQLSKAFGVKISNLYISSIPEIPPLSNVVACN